MKKIPLLLLFATMVFLCSCSGSQSDNAEKSGDKQAENASEVINAVNNYCDNVEKAIADEVIDDKEAKLIKDSEKNYMDLIAKINKSYGSNLNERAEFEQKYTSDNVWNRMSDLNAKLADTEGYIKLSLTNK